MNTKPGSRNIMILSAGFGYGHLAAAYSLQESLRAVEPGLQTEVEDLLEILTPSMTGSLYDSYNLMVEKADGFYNYFYKRKRHGSDFMTSKMLLKRILPRLINLIETRSPQLIISTFPLCASYASYLKMFYRPDLKLVTCITDIVDSREWIHPGTDLYLVANSKVKESLLALGVPGSQVLAGGIPVRQAFLASETEPADLTPYQLDKGRRLILIMGGGAGHLPEDMVFYRHLDEMSGVNSLVICGHNARLLKKLQKLKPGGGLRACGFSHDVPALMRRADLLITRASGISLFEAIASELPLVIYRPRMGQELANSHYVRQKGLGMVAQNPHEIISSVTWLLLNDDYRNRLQARLKQERMSMAWHDIPYAIIDLLEDSSHKYQIKRSQGQ